MKRTYNILLALLLAAGLHSATQAQDDIYPAKPYTGHLFITGGTVHVGNGQVIDNATIEVNDGKIVKIGTNITPAGDAKTIGEAGWSKRESRLRIATSPAKFTAF